MKAFFLGLMVLETVFSVKYAGFAQSVDRNYGKSKTGWVFGAFLKMVSKKSSYK